MYPRRLRTCARAEEVEWLRAQVAALEGMLDSRLA